MREYRVSGPGHMLPNLTKQAITTAGIYNLSVSVLNIQVWSCWSHPDPEGHSTLWSSLQVVRKVQNRQQCVSFAHTTPYMCLNTDLKRLSLEAHVIQGQYAIPPPHWIKLPLWAMQRSYFSIMHDNPVFNDIESTLQK